MTVYENYNVIEFKSCIQKFTAHLIKSVYVVCKERGKSIENLRKINQCYVENNGKMNKIVDNC